MGLREEDAPCRPQAIQDEHYDGLSMTEVGQSLVTHQPYANALVVQHSVQVRLHRQVAHRLDDILPATCRQEANGQANVAQRDSVVKQPQ